MGSESVQLWRLVARQHGVVARAQLRELGYTDVAIRHRVAKGRLHRVFHGVYAVGRPRLGRHGMWMAAVLSCGPDAALSHESGAALLEIRARDRDPVDVSVPASRAPRGARPGIVIHRRARLAADEITSRHGIPVTGPARTLLDLAPRITRDELEAAVGEADRRGLIDPERLRSEAELFAGHPGVVALRHTLDSHTFTLTDSQLERRFLPLARAAGLPRPLTQHRVNGFRVDFWWPELGLVVETDGLRYHRTPAQQATDRLRDQTHIAAGLTPLRFTHAQVAFHTDHVRRTLTEVARRLRP